MDGKRRESTGGGNENFTTAVTNHDKSLMNYYSSIQNPDGSMFGHGGLFN